MTTERRSALLAGSLLIFATTAGVALAGALIRPVVGDPVDLATVAANRGQLFLGVLVHLVGDLACPGIVLALYPVLRHHSPTLAMGAVAFRVAEAMGYLLGLLALVLLVTLADQAAAAGAGDRTAIDRLAALLMAGRSWIGFVGAVAFFGVGTLCYDAVLYRARLVPRWLAGAGILAVVSSLTAGALVLLGVIVPMSPAHLALNLPIAVQELVLGGWLIVRGLRSVPAPAAVQRGTAVAAVAGAR